MLQNRIKAPVEGFRTLLGDVAAYRTFLGAADAAAALAKTYTNFAVDDGTQPRPRGLVDLDRSDALKQTNLSWYFGDDNEILFALEWEGDHTDWSTFAGHVNDIIDGIFELAGTDTYLNLTRFRSEILWQRNQPDHSDGVEYWVHESFWGFEG